MIVLHLFVPDRKTVRQSATWTLLEQLRRHGRHVVIDWPTVDELDNARGLQFCWDRGHDLLVLEQDVVPTLEDLVRLELCREGFVCTQATRAAAAAVGYDFRIRQPDGSFRWGRLGEPWADLFPLGCTVFHRRVMAHLSVPLVPWPELDTTLAMRWLPAGAHVHWPAAAHNH